VSVSRKDSSVQSFDIYVPLMKTVVLESIVMIGSIIQDSLSPEDDN
jgi:hypothetical protein